MATTQQCKQNRLSCHMEERNEGREEEDAEEVEREKLHSLQMLVRDIEMANARKAELEAELKHGDVEVVVDSNEEGNGEGKKTEQINLCMVYFFENGEPSEYNHTIFLC